MDLAAIFNAASPHDTKEMLEKQEKAVDLTTTFSAESHHAGIQARTSSEQHGNTANQAPAQEASKGHREEPGSHLPPSLLPEAAVSLGSRFGN